MCAKSDPSIIPIGPYCYDSEGPCPYWVRRTKEHGIDEEEHKQSFGYCVYLGKGDIEINRERLLTSKAGEEFTADELDLPLSLLWDQCKECGINEDYEDDMGNNWNYRVFRYKDGGLGIHETYYNKEGKIICWTENAVGVETTESGIEGLLDVLDTMRKDILDSKEDILDYDMKPECEIEGE